MVEAINNPPRKLREVRIIRSAHDYGVFIGISFANFSDESKGRILAEFARNVRREDPFAQQVSMVRLRPHQEEHLVANGMVNIIFLRTSVPQNPVLKCKGEKNWHLKVIKVAIKPAYKLNQQDLDALDPGQELGQDQKYLVTVVTLTH